MRGKGEDEVNDGMDELMLRCDDGYGNGNYDVG